MLRDLDGLMLVSRPATLLSFLPCTTKHVPRCDSMIQEEVRAAHIATTKRQKSLSGSADLVGRYANEREEALATQEISTHTVKMCECNN